MAVALCGKCLKRIPFFYCASSKTRFNLLSSDAAEEEINNSDSTSKYVFEISREKTKVLEALASTIQHVPNAPIHGFFEDPFLMPRTSIRKVEFMKAREEGKNAAKYIINTYPQLFPLRKPEPAWPKEVATKINGDDENTLQDLIALRQTEKAIDFYKQLLERGETISLDCKNKLLELTGYHGTKYSDNISEMSEEVSEDKETKKWSTENFAHQLFTQMSNKNNRSYEAMILSLLKFQSNRLALEIFEEMKKKNCKGSVFLYNQLIENSEQLCQGNIDPWTFSQDIIKHLNCEPVVKPNLGTFISLLKICAFHSPKAYEDATKIIKEMYSLDLEPSLGCYTHLLQAAEKERVGHVCINNIVAHLKSLNHQFIPESKADYEFFIMAMATARHFRDGPAARELFQLTEMKNYKQFLGPRPLSFYGNLLCSLALSEHASTVMEVYHQLVPKYFVPREWIYVELLRCIEKSKQPHRAIELYNDIKQYRVNMTVSTCRTFVSCFSLKLAKEHLGEYTRIIEEIFQWMEFFDVHIDNFMMSQMIRINCLNEHVDTAWKNMEKFSERGFVPTFAALSSLLLSSLNAKDKEKAKRVFEMVASRGFKLSASLRNVYYRGLDFTAEECYKIDQLYSKLPSRTPQE